jgi:hypothetical protein
MGGLTRLEGEPGHAELRTEGHEAAGSFLQMHAMLVLHFIKISSHFMKDSLAGFPSSFVI